MNTEFGGTELVIMHHKSKPRFENIFGQFPIVQSYFYNCSCLNLPLGLTYLSDHPFQVYQSIEKKIIEKKVVLEPLPVHFFLCKWIENRLKHIDSKFQLLDRITKSWSKTRSTVEPSINYYQHN